VAAIRNNHVLMEFDGAENRSRTDSYHIFANPNQRSLLEAFPRLNKADRGYLKDDPTCISKGVEVLRKVMGEESYTDLQVLDCLLLHLLENPLLCKAPPVRMWRE
jgi:hypothetical protein